MTMLVRDQYGWELSVLEELEDGILVDWRLVGPKDIRFIPHGEYVVVQKEDLKLECDVKSAQKPKWEVNIQSAKVNRINYLHLTVEAKASRMNVVITPYEYGNLISIVEIGVCVGVGDLSDEYYINQKLRKNGCNRIDAQSIAYAISLYHQFKENIWKVG